MFKIKKSPGGDLIPIRKPDVLNSDYFRKIKKVHLPE